VGRSSVLLGFEVDSVDDGIPSLLFDNGDFSILNGDHGVVCRERQTEIVGDRIFEEEIEIGWDSFDDAVDAGV